MIAPQTFADVIKKWPSTAVLAADTGVKEVTARAWRKRGIPAEYWRDVLAAAARRDIEGVTCELLAGLAAAKANRPKTTQ